MNSIIIKNWSRKESDIVPQARLTEDLGADDLDIVEAIIEIEVALKISIPDDVAEKIKTVGDFYQVAIKRSCDHK
ncbi:MAG: acyl carrier protein [Chitinophagaceae bacterium]